MGFTSEQARAAGKKRAESFTREYQQIAYQAAIAKVGGQKEMSRRSAIAIAARPLNNPESRVMEVVAGLGYDNAEPTAIETQYMWYPVDLYIESANLIIQIDGVYYHNTDRQENDRRIDQALLCAGYKVLRVTDEEINTNINNVQLLIEAMM